MSQTDFEDLLHHTTDGNVEKWVEKQNETQIRRK